MNAKVLKRLIALVMSALLMLGASVSAFATDDVSANTTNYDQTSLIASTSTRKNTPSSAVCEPFDEIKLYPTLDSYIGFQKTFLFYTTTLDSDTTPVGYMYVELIDPSGETIWDNDDQPVYPDKDYEVTFWLPSSGQYTVKVKSYYRYNLNCNAVWYA